MLLERRASLKAADMVPEHTPSRERQDMRDAGDAQVLRDLLAHGLGGALGSRLLLLDQLIGRHHPLPKLLCPGPQG